MSITRDRFTIHISIAAVATALCVTGCADDDNVNTADTSAAPPPSTTPDTPPTAPAGGYAATIRTTTNGVPHILAADLGSAAFGEGYVQARDSVCLIADSILRATGRRAAFYGPGPDNINVVTDFSYRALGLLDKAKAEFDTLSADSRDMITGFAAGYNKYVAETPPGALPAKCANGAWVQPITPQELYAYYQLTALYASGDQFVTGVTFSAAPPGVNPLPRPAAPAAGAARDQARLDLRAANRVARLGQSGGAPADIGATGDWAVHDIASNAWGLGREATENGRGALLANPHFPYTGNRRLYQSQITVPGRYNVNGATLIGVAIPLIGFNEHLGWSHTVSTARHFTAYQLTLADGSDLAYVKDGQTRPITQRDITIEVANGTPTPTQLTKTFYYSEYGPMLAANLLNANLPAWGAAPGSGPRVAFTYRDANADTARQTVDQWLAMGSATNLNEFQAPFQACGSVLWTNTVYADDAGNSFYIDASATPHLSDEALAALAARRAASPLVAGLYQAGVTLLDGSTSRDDWVEGDCDGRVPYAGQPKLVRSDYVQNANDSFWVTNPNALLTDYSPLFGSVGTPLSPRTRMSLAMLANPTDAGLSDVKPGGDDGKFTAREIIDALYSNRAYYADTLLPILRERCTAAGDQAIDIGNDDTRSVAAGCAALAGWNGVYDNDSTGAAVFRVFIAEYASSIPDDFTVAFNPDAPATTPSTPNAATPDLGSDPLLTALARGLNTLDTAGIAYDAPLSAVQYERQSASARPGGAAQFAGPRIPWHGAQNVEGGFNIVEPDTSPVEEGTRYVRVAPSATLPRSGQLSATSGEGWSVARGTSWHFGLAFTDSGPEAYGLVSYSQSDDAGSPYFSDQDMRYSNKNPRRLRFTEAEIAADENLQQETIRTGGED